MMTGHVGLIVLCIVLLISGCTAGSSTSARRSLSPAFFESGGSGLGHNSPGSGSGSGCSSSSCPPPIPNSGPLQCAKGFQRFVFTFFESVTSNTTANLFDLQTLQMIGNASGLCPEIPGTMGISGVPLLECLFTFTFFPNTGVPVAGSSFVGMGTYDPSPFAVGNTAAVGINGLLFSAHGAFRVVNLANGVDSIDTIVVCIVKQKNKPSCGCDEDGKGEDEEDDDKCEKQRP